jgi:hypothetical protein
LSSRSDQLGSVGRLIACHHRLVEPLGCLRRPALRTRVVV